MNLYRAQTVNGLSDFFTVAEFSVEQLELVVALLVVELIALWLSSSTTDFDDLYIIISADQNVKLARKIQFSVQT